MSAFFSIDWRAVLAVCGILSALLLLIAWNHKQSPHTGGLWLSHSALSLELLGLALSLFWAVNAPDGAVMPVIFCAGWIGMLIGRAVLINYSVNAWQRGRGGVVAGATLTLCLAYLALYGSGLFHAVNDAADSANARLESSRPALALDAEIETTRGRIAALAGFADASRAHAEESAQATATADYDAHQQQLQADLAAARATLAGCPPHHNTRCISPARAEIASLETRLAGLSPTATSAGYGSRHAEYNGLQQHLVALENRRAELALNGQGAAQAWKAEDRMLAWLFGIEPETASRVKWLVATAIFDILSLLFRIFAALALGKSDPETQARRRLDTLLNGGFDVQEAARLVSGNRQPAAEMPHYRHGGHVPTDGLAVLHAGEYVMPPEAVSLHGLDKLDAMRQAAMSATASRLDGKPLERQTVGAGATVRQCAHCGHDFTVTRKDRKYCGDECRASAWEQRTGAKLRKGRR